MPQIVEIPDVGEVEFPDAMSAAEISEAIQGKILGGKKVEPPEDNGKGRIASAGSSFMQGGASGAGQSLQGAARLLDFFASAGADSPEAMLEILGRTPQQKEADIAENPLYQKGGEIVEGAKEAFQPNPKFRGEFFTDTIPSSAGGMVPTIAAGAALGPVAAGLQYGTSQGQAEAEAAIDAGHVEDADKVFLLNLGIGSASEIALGVPARIWKLVNRARKAGLEPGVAKELVLKEMAKGAGREAAQEGLEQAGQNVIAGGTYDPNRKLLENVPESAAAGLFLGGGASGVASGVGLAGRQPPPAPPAEPRISTTVQPPPGSVPRVGQQAFPKNEGGATMATTLTKPVDLPQEAPVAPAPAPAAVPPAEPAPVSTPVAEPQEVSGWTPSGVRQIGGIALDSLSPDQVAELRKKVPVQVEYTDRRSGSPTEGFTIYAPEGSTAEAVQALIDAKAAEVAKKAPNVAPLVKQAEIPAQVAPVKPSEPAVKPPEVKPAAKVPPTPAVPAPAAGAANFKAGDKVMVRITPRGNKFHDATVTQIQPDGTMQVRITKDGSFRTVKPSQVNDRPAAAGKKMFEAEFEGMSDSERAQAKRDHADFIKLVKEAGPEHGWLPAEATQVTDLKAEGNQVSEMVRSAIRRAWQEAGLDGNPESALDRSKNLAKLRAYVKENPGRQLQEAEFENLTDEKREGTFEQDMGETVVGTKIEVDGTPLEVTKIENGEITLSDGRRFGVQKIGTDDSLWVEKVTHPEDESTEFLPEEPAAVEPAKPAEPPKLRPGEKGTGDLLQNDQPFNLAGEKASDGDRIAAEKAKAEADAAEANRIEAENQSELVGMGGAIPAEFARGGGSPTAMKYRLIDEERQKRGLPPLVTGGSVSDQAVMDRAIAAVDQNPQLPEQLIDELTKNPRVIEDWENHVLLLRKIDLRDAYDKSARAAVTAYEDSKQFPERKAEMISHNAETQRLSDEMTKLEKASRLSGSARGRALRSLRVMANEDYSLAAMEMGARASKNGAPLTDAERAELVKRADEYKAKSEALEKDVATRDERISKLLANDEIERQKAAAQARPPQFPEVIIKKAEEIVASLDKRKDAAWERIRKRGGSTFTGVDPTVLRDVAEIGAAHIAHIGLDFAKWSSRMVEDFGPKVKPHLDTLWKMGQAIIDDIGKDKKATAAVKTGKATPKESAKATIKERVEKGERNKIAGQVQKLLRSLVAEGITEREALVDVVHAILQDIDPTFTRRETMDAISGYGDFKQLSKDEISIILRGVKGELQQIAKLEDMANGIPPSKTGVERRTPTDEEKRLIRAVNEAKVKFQVPITDPRTQLKSALDTRKAQLQARKAEYERRIAEGDFDKKPRRKLNLDEDAKRLEFEVFKVKKRYQELLMQNRLANRNIAQKIIGGVGEGINTVRSILTSMDLSAVLRQGGFVTLSHPIRGIKAMPAMFKALRSEAGAHAVDVAITKRANYPLYAASKLYLSEHGQKLSQMEEAYMSRWADKIPGVAASQRAYTTFLNQLRADSFDAMAAGLTPDGNITAAEGKIIANFINVATGRGNFGANDNALVGLNTVFFAPRYAASRFQLLAMQPLYHGLITGDRSMRTGTGKVRAQIAMEYARFLLAAGVVYALGAAAGGDIEDDPRSSDFGKVRFGNTRIDPMAGLIQATVFMSRMASGEKKTLGGKVMPAKSSDTLINFLRNKLSPAIGASLDARDIILDQKPPPGHPQTLPELGKNIVVPISFGDIYKTMKEQGVPAGTALAILAIFGMGLQNYDEAKK